MSTAQRIKGQEVSLLITNAGELEDTLTDIQNFNMEYEFETKSQGYLGEKTNRQDSIFNGIKFDFEIHVHTQDVLPSSSRSTTKRNASRPTPFSTSRACSRSRTATSRSFCFPTFRSDRSRSTSGRAAIT